jgi:hypothetical protein
VSVHIYSQTDIDSRDAAVRGMPGDVYENDVRSQVRCDWSPVTRTWSVRKDRLGDLRVALDRAQVRYSEHDTGAPPPAMLTKERAQYLVGAIRSGLAVLHPMVVEAYEGRAWEPLGYTSWKALCESEFALTLAVPQRREAVRELTEAGLSTRAQADVLGVDQRTVNRDQHQVRHSASPESAAPQLVRGLDGKTYPSAQPATAVFSWQDSPATAAPHRGRDETNGVAVAPPQPLRGDVRVEAALAGFAADDITATPSRIALLRASCERWLAERDGWDR